MIAAIREASGNPDVKARRFPWLLMRMLSPFVPLFRELAEMRYLWTTATHMGNDRLIKILGAEPRTPLSIAVRETLAGMGCLPDAMRQNVYGKTARNSAPVSQDAGSE
jgi:nucleoside-diphosphate-sugar epimerase